MTSEKNLRWQLAAFLVAAGAGFYFHLSFLEMGLIVAISAVVLAMEFANSALEYLADAVHPGHNSLVGYAKDVAAGAVLIASLAAVIIAALLFLPKVW
jgi:diacylglycerol kinase (ATP)